MFPGINFKPITINLIKLMLDFHTFHLSQIGLSAIIKDEQHTKTRLQQLV